MYIVPFLTVAIALKKSVYGVHEFSGELLIGKIFCNTVKHKARF